MRWVAILAMLACAGCDQLGLGPKAADSAPAPVAAATPAAVPDLRPRAGETYPELVDAQPDYGVEGLRLSEAEAARFSRLMAIPAESWLVGGGGAEALVFTGCAAGGCAEGRAVLAIDLATGQSFLGLRDAEGAAEVLRQDRVEGLLRFNSPTRHWAETRAPETSSEPSAAP